MQEDREENQYYRALMALKPENLSANAWLSRAQVNRSFFSDLRYAKGEPSTRNLVKILEQVGYSYDEFQSYLSNPGRPALVKSPAQPQVRAPSMEFRGLDRPRDIPVLGLSECADIEVSVDGETVSIEAVEMHFDDVIDHIKRPLALEGRNDVYGIFQSGFSLSPKYEPGEPAYVDPVRPPMVGDYVVVQLRAPDEQDGERVVRVITKRLVKQTAAFLELEQFNPPLIFRLARKDVARMHRIIPWSELVSF